MSPLTPAAALATLLAAAPLAVSAPAVAGPLSALAKLAKAGSAVGKVGKAGKLAAGAKTAKLVTTAGAAIAAERAAVVFAHTGDDLGRAAAYLGKDASGEFRLIVKNGAADVTTPNPATAISDLPHGQVDVYVDLSAARHPRSLPAPSDDVRLFVLDAEAKPHPLRVEQGEDGVIRHVVDHAGDAVDLGSFVSDQLAEDVAEEPEPLSFVPFVIGTTAVGSIGVLGLFWWRRRKRAAQGVPGDV